MTLTAIATFIAEIGVLLGVIKWVAKTYKENAEKVELVAEGVKCQLRSDMLQIYYRHCDTKTIRQYEYENFIMLYGAYRALGGNSFIEKIKNDIEGWKITT